MKSIADNFNKVRNHITQLSVDAGRGSDEVQLIAVSKTRSLSEVEQAIAAGQTVFAENTIQDALTKIPLLNLPEYKNLEWHFIGHLQSKKSKQVAEHFQWVHTIDSLKLAKKLSSAMQQYKAEGVLNCLLQVNLSGEANKSGLSQDETLALLDELLVLNLPNLAWRGLMTMGVKDDETRTRKVFSDLKSLLDQCVRSFDIKEFDQLSMGMSDDYPIAIEEGASMVRIGSDLFGARK